MLAIDTFIGVLSLVIAAICLGLAIGERKK